jgi:uncharacterized protein YcbX
MNRRVGHVAGLWRYPIKSLAGEPMEALSFDRRGVELDRLWALADSQGAVASGKTTRRFRKVPGLLCHSGRMQDGVPVIALADGRSARVGTAEAQALVREIAGPEWSIQREGAVPHFDAGAVHIVTTATLATVSAAAHQPVVVERLRPNILIDTGEDGFPEDAWTARALRVGDVELRVLDRTERCVMVNHAQSALPARRDVLKTVGRVNGAYAGVYAEVLRPGIIRLGAAVTMLAIGEPAPRGQSQPGDSRLS